MTPATTASALNLGHIEWAGEGSCGRRARKNDTVAFSVYYKKISESLWEAQQRRTANKLQSRFGAAYALWTRAGWDGEGAFPISSKTIANTITFLDLIGDLSDNVEITPEADGYIQLEWFKAPNKLLSLSFGPSNVLSYSGIFGDGCTTYGAETFTETIPDSIWSLIRRINRL
jgi:hypothetical protein